MSALLPATSVWLRDLFASPYRFSIPEYQRQFAWTANEAGVLFNDLLYAAGVRGTGEPDYYLSTILLMEPPGSTLSGAEAGARHEIVDGQQRLVTLSLLIAVLRDFVAGPTVRRLEALVKTDSVATDVYRQKDFMCRIVLRPSEQPFYERFLQVQAVRAAPLPDQALTTAEKNLRDVYQHFLKVVSELAPRERETLATYLCERCHFVVILAPEVARAQRLFTIINQRGIPLQRNDVLKAEVLRQVPAKRLVDAAAQWDRTACLLAGEFEAFFGHLRDIYDPQKPQIVATIRARIAELGPERFLEREFTPLSLAFHDILSASKPGLVMDETVRRHLVYLGRLNGTEWVPAAMLVLRRMSDNVARARDLMGAIDRLAHLFRILSMGAGKRTTRFNAVAARLRDNEDVRADDAVFQLSREEIRTVMYHLRDLHRRGPQVCKLVLLKIDDAIAGCGPVADPSAYTVEHVLPHRTPLNGEWRRLFPGSEQRETLTESLGNLVLISQKQNERAKNQEFLAKQAIYKSPEDSSPLLMLTRPVLEARTWTPESVLTREAAIFAALNAMWGLPVELKTPSRLALISQDTSEDKMGSEMQSRMTAIRNILSAAQET